MEQVKEEKKRYKTISREEAEEIRNEGHANQSSRERAAEALAGIDELLDDIEVVLEENEFVEAYVQKGGQ